MNQAIVNPADLRRFARVLQRFNEQLSEMGAAVNGQMTSLAQTWRDQEHTKFAEEFSVNLKAMAKLVEANEEHIPYLLRKAQLIEEYLQQR